MHDSMTMTLQPADVTLALVVMIEIPCAADARHKRVLTPLFGSSACAVCEVKHNAQQEG